MGLLLCAGGAGAVGSLAMNVVEVEAQWEEPGFEAWVGSVIDPVLRRPLQRWQDLTPRGGGRGIRPDPHHPSLRVPEEALWRQRDGAKRRGAEPCPPEVAMRHWMHRPQRTHLAPSHLVLPGEHAPPASHHLQKSPTIIRHTNTNTSLMTRFSPTLKKKESAHTAQIVLIVSDNSGLTHSTSSKCVIIKLVDVILLLYQPFLFLLQGTIFIQRLRIIYWERERDKSISGQWPKAKGVSIYTHNTQH